MQPTYNQRDGDTTNINTATAPLAPCQQPPSYAAATRHPPDYEAATRQPPLSQQHHADSHQPDTVTALLEPCQESTGIDPHEPPSCREQRFPASTSPAGVTLSPATASAQCSIVSQPAAATSGAGNSSATTNTPSAVQITAQYDDLSNWRTSTAGPVASADDAGVVGRHRIASFARDRHFRSDVVSIV